MLYTLQDIMDTLSSAAELIKRNIELPLHSSKEWSKNSDFQIDALGLVTLLGAEEVNRAVGSLQHQRYTRALPLLAAFVVAGDRFTEEQPGFVLYNFSDGIITTELKGWFTRWLMCQKVNNATTVFEWKQVDPHADRHNWNWVAPTISFFSILPLLALTLLMGDWYGLGNTAAIILTVITRLHIVAQQRKARDDLANKPINEYDEGSLVFKTLCVLRSDGKMVTIKVPKSVLMTFVTSQRVDKPKYYRIARRVAWLALGAHMLILGMCTLVTQIYTVILLVFSTWALSSNLDAKFEREEPTTEVFGHGKFKKSTITLPFSREWVVTKTDYPAESTPANTAAPGAPVTKKEPSPSEEKRQVAWARLLLDERQERMMEHWNLFPYENPGWRDNYENLKTQFEHWAQDPNEKQTPVSASSTAAPTFPPTTPPHPDATSSPSSQHLLPGTSPSGLSGSSIGDTPTPDTSRSPTPSNPGNPGVTSANPSSTV